MRRIVTAFGVVLALARVGNAQVGAGTSLFNKGRVRAMVTGGYASFNNKDYFVLGLGAGYYLFNGLEAGVDGEVWLGARMKNFSTVTHPFTPIALKPIPNSAFPSATDRCLEDIFSTLIAPLV